MNSVQCRKIAAAQPVAWADDHSGRERHGDRRPRHPSPESICAGSAQHHSVYRLSSRGTHGTSLVQWAETIKIHGEYIPVRAEVRMLGNLSAHADADEILGWLKGFTRPPRRTFITHGEPEAADALRHRIEEELRWSCTIPDYLEREVLGGTA